MRCAILMVFLLTGAGALASPEPSTPTKSTPEVSRPVLDEPWQSYAVASRAAWNAWWDELEAMGEAADHIDIDAAQATFFGRFGAEHPELIRRIMTASRLDAPTPSLDQAPTTAAQESAYAQNLLSRVQPIRSAAIFLVDDANRCVRDGLDIQAARRFEAMGGLIRQLGKQPSTIESLVTESLVALIVERTKPLVERRLVGPEAARVIVGIWEERAAQREAQFRSCVRWEYPFCRTVVRDGVRWLAQNPTRHETLCLRSTDPMGDAGRWLVGAALWCHSWISLTARIKCEAYLDAFAARQLAESPLGPKRLEMMQKMNERCGPTLERLREIGDQTPD